MAGEQQRKQKGRIFDKRTEPKFASVKIDLTANKNGNRNNNLDNKL